MTAVDYLRKHQLPNGSFLAYSSPILTSFKDAKVQPTIFPTVLILDSLHGVIGADDISRRAADYLYAQVSMQGSWNYWDYQSRHRTNEPYPDDLDDTSGALAAITRFNPQWVGCSRLGQFARLLVAAEQQPGGPYNTWLIDSKSASQWQDIDLAVNANTAYCLSLYSAVPKALVKYVEATVFTSTYKSSYYVGELPVLYFILRWYSGPELPKLQQKLKSYIQIAPELNGLELALLLSSACRAGIHQKVLSNVARRLRSLQVNGHWCAEAFYVDPVYAGQQHYGGSEFLTTAFALEALSLYEKVEPIKTPKIDTLTVESTELLPVIIRDIAGVTSSALRKEYMTTVGKIMRSKSGLQITAPATLVAKAGNWKVPQKILDTLNSASLHGWLAYTIYDDFLDGTGSPQTLNVATIALRLSYQKFSQALAPEYNFADFVSRTFNTIDSANYWELTHARASVTDGIVTIINMPNYRSYKQLADKSLGHQLAVCSLATIHYGSIGHPNLTALQSFYKHFLIARQLNDDAHDWEDDLKAGHLSAVVSIILQDAYSAPCSIMLDAALPKLRQQFWQHNLGQVVDLITSHIVKATKALHDIDDQQFNHDLFLGWLEALQLAADTALQGQKDTLQFIEAYEESYA